MGNKDIPGSFFNPVPEKKDEDEEGDDSSQSIPQSNKKSVIEDSLNDMIINRKKSRVRTTSAAGTGFGKRNSAQPITKEADYVAIGKPDRKLNDVNNPQFDDKGYTLYADENTGKQTRVFEALVEYPCEFQIKIVGANDGTFVTDMIALVAESCGVKSDAVSWTERLNGKWVSITVNAPVQSAEMLYALYEDIDKDARVKFKF
eukprot:CAMPEP_0171323672 /NCGR_PEP_ID=MMETSP0816-20121228/115721_1 /TAXON_ID=420281 /ORGANISM="Proboscia inermis, Strain CCAP1064/1" /LENGTH=202 /DNA_ID=CAMNT_0011822439 /DNA_START=547 /DNA_END=1155 /DNA_ORIENTATION=+